ncbi:acetyltransferase (GNAT) family protein [Roseovarius halotolerans]|uniref:Acetyltransferase (GNAT) family protein n=1 Tax=Roseovarius halotolerans TaxID=505353 RepID=A0A1X6ZP55_9RHOB|nr:GNAT family N-acetyltransferase [Roseovarius halotolerans]RKT28127.1 acetyltransferase (GNAT) family protein [Roseovarius halotolerans]SLN56747.1 Acetyltransferase (GNAT) family protein [Roseovarius halotolerans]
MIRVERLTGEVLAAALEDVARLRIEVFHAWPYLYDGDETYEEHYLQTYRDSDDAILVGAFDGTRLIGAATGTPLEDHADDFRAAFDGQDIDMKDVFYCAESVLLPAYRGQGIGHAFFDAREAHARAMKRRHAAFCAVVRPDDHPMKPAQYQSLDPFWRKRGYVPLAGAVASFRWKDVDQPDETAHDLQVWCRTL